MATNVQQILSTLGDVLQALAGLTVGSVPGTNDTERALWISWINQGQEDAANRGFWSRLLTKTNLSIVINVDTATLPNNFHKRNGIYILSVNDIDWADPANDPVDSEKQKLFVHLNATTGVWEVVFNGFTPTASSAGTLWYFFLPPKLVDDTDKLFLDGKMVLYYALQEYWRREGDMDALADAREEYLNRFDEGLSLDQLPAKNELLSFSDIYHNQHINRDERSFYSGRERRSRR